MSVEFEKKGRNPHVNKGEKDKRFSTLADARVSALHGKPENLSAENYFINGIRARRFCV